jgi:lysophospholipase L1-like esterase
MSKKKKIILIICASILILGLVSGLLYLFLEYLPEKREKKEMERLVKEYYAAKYVKYAEENERYGDYEVDVAFIGDSLTDGYDLEKYYPEYLVSNRGIGGETTHGLLARLDLSVYQLKPKVIVMLIGANNFSTMFEDYEDLIIGIRENLPDTELIVCSLTSMGGEHWGKNNKIAAFNNVKIKAYAEKHGCHFVDLFTPLLNLETNEIYEHYTTDGGHLTHEGYVVLTENIKPVIDEILKNENGAQ